MKPVMAVSAVCLLLAGCGRSPSRSTPIDTAPPLVDTTPPTVDAFVIPETTPSLAVPITELTATDDVGVSGYLIGETAVPPPATAAGWSAAAPASHLFGAAGRQTLYAWARDAAGNVSASASASVTIGAQPSGPEPAGWYAGDMHVHRSCGGPAEALSSLVQKMGAQDLAVLSLLADMGNGEVQDPLEDLPRVTGQDDPRSSSSRLVHWDAEWHWDAVYSAYPHQALGGHVVALGVTEAQQAWEEYTYPIFQWAHQHQGIAGFAHMEYLDDGLPQGLTCCTPLEYPVEVALGASDFVSEDVADGRFSGETLHPESAIRAYYRLLNCGFRPGLAAGTDSPCNGDAGPGALLTYVQVAGGQLTYRGWITGIAQGRTVVSRNGHDEFLSLQVNGAATPGDEVRLPAPAGVPVSILWTAKRPLAGAIELVQDGRVVASQAAAAEPGAPASWSTTASFTRSGWLAARRMGPGGHQLHTAAVFVLVGGAPIRASAADAQFYVQWMDGLLEKTAPGGIWGSYFVNSRAAAQERYQAARARYRQIALEAGAPP